MNCTYGFDVLFRSEDLDREAKLKNPSADLNNAYLAIRRHML